VKLIKADKDQFSFQMDAKERQILFELLSLYPVIPAAHQRLSKNETQAEGNQMLEAALAGLRRENKRQIESLVKSATVWIENEQGYGLFLSAGQLEWLLQVLNDVRVGSWVAMGSPDGHEEALAAVNSETGQYYWAMEVSGHFQMVFLRAITASEKNQTADE
jgi:hypothetical protein